MGIRNEPLGAGLWALAEEESERTVSSAQSMPVALSCIQPYVPTKPGGGEGGREGGG